MGKASLASSVSKSAPLNRIRPRAAAADGSGSFSSPLARISDGGPAPKRSRLSFKAPRTSLIPKKSEQVEMDSQDDTDFDAALLLLDEMDKKEVIANQTLL